MLALGGLDSISVRPSENPPPQHVRSPKQLTGSHKLDLLCAYHEGLRNWRLVMNSSSPRHDGLVSLTWRARI
ncbi:hypothetical protein V2G26_019134 [Clonostachys chloroleuca]